MIGSPSKRPTGRSMRCLLVATLAVAAVTLSAAPALAAGPIWHITMEHHNAYGCAATDLVCINGPGGFDPFIPGDKGKTFAKESGGNVYALKVTNTGEASLATVVDQLPSGMSLGGFSVSESISGTGWSCKILPGAVSAECLSTAPIASGPGSEIVLRVHVDSQAVNPSRNVATVTSAPVPGSSASTTPEEGETAIASAVPFGVHCFAVNTLEEAQAEKHPCEQAPGVETPSLLSAGGHPFSQGAEFVVNSTTANKLAKGGLTELAPAGGAAKELQVELPGGFSGDPQNLPQCPLVMLRGFSGGSRCPERTAVGFTNVVFNTQIEGGVARPFPSAKSTILVYNMQPAPGHPAEFGFVVQNYVPFLIEASVRNNGDYGVNVGDTAIGEKPLAVRTTFCEYGAHLGGSLPGEEKGIASCNKPSETTRVPLGAKPFLTNPTQCSSAPPVWNLQANPWVDPTDLQSKTAAPNLVTGCQSLTFAPELEFKPSLPSEGGTTQADEPTGVTVNLKLPQTNDPASKATPDLKNVVMTLPAGMGASASAADGLQACSNAQFGLGTEFGPGSIKTVPERPANPAKCPTASQIGTVEVFTPLLSGAPAIEGEGVGLRCLHGEWANNPTEYSFQWLRNGVPVPEATANEFSNQKKEAVQCQVTAKNAGGSSVAVSSYSVDPEPSPLPPVPPPSIQAPSGSASTGGVLTCNQGVWTGPAPTFAYQWLRGGVPIAGATAKEYTLTSEDEGKAIQCQVTGQNGSAAAIVDSAAVVPSPSASSPPPPLPGAAVQGQVFLGEPECSPCTTADDENGKVFRLFLQIRNARDGVLIKLHGTTVANPSTGQLTTTFLQQPQQPFELLQLKLNGGARATLATPQSCGPATTSADLTPWSEQPDAIITSTFNVTGCSATMPFSPSFNAGTTTTNAGAYTSFQLTLGRNDREQDLSGVTVHMPLGLTGKIAGIPQCGEAEVHAAEANTGGCSAASEIGTTETGAGPGPHPFFTEGHVYLTGPTTLKNGLHGPFGLAIVTLAKAGPFNFGNVVVRSAINIDPRTAAVTVTSDPLPQYVDGVQLRLRQVNVNVHKQGFMLNPTNCSSQQVSTTLTGLQGATAQVGSPFGIGGCTGLAFKPTFTATTEGSTSKVNGASLDVKITYPPGAYANIAKSVTELPNALPSRLTTIQKACVDTVFEANPAACDEGSVIGHAIAYTPLLAKPLTGPAYLVSHGNRAFPDIEIVLQGEGITVDLDGLTDIKKGVTKTTFESLPDSPISTFELMLPEGPHSALAANVNLCEQAAINLPTILTGQNGAVEKQETKIAVTGCPPTVSLARARISGNALLVTVRTSAKGTVKVAGKGLKTTSKNLNAGTYQIRVPFTKAGRSLRKHHKKTSVRISLTVGKQAVAKATTVRL